MGSSKGFRFLISLLAFSFAFIQLPAFSTANAAEGYIVLQNGPLDRENFDDLPTDYDITQVSFGIEEEYPDYYNFFVSFINPIVPNQFDGSNGSFASVLLDIDNDGEQDYSLETSNKSYDGNYTHAAVLTDRRNDNNEIIDIFNIKKNDDKAQIFYKYLKRTNQIDLNYKQKKNKIKICSQCNIDKVLHLQDGLISCVQCGNCDFILVDSDIPSYKNQIVDNKPNGYKRMNHFSELLNQFQGKESTEIPNEVFEKIIDEINKLRIEDLSTLNNYTIRAILKKLNLNFYYEHIPYIINKLNGIPPPSINRELEDKLRQMFKEVQEPFILYKPKNRKNFLNNNYVFRKLFELLEADHLLSSFPFLKSKEKLYEHDQIWKKICDYNNWQFIESI